MGGRIICYNPNDPDDLGTLCDENYWGDPDYTGYDDKPACTNCGAPNPYYKPPRSKKKLPVVKFGKKDMTPKNIKAWNENQDKKARGEMIVIDEPPADDLKLFLRESNAIEGVYDDESLDYAKRAWDYLISFDELTEENILKTHDILMTKHLKPLERGCFRKVPVWIGGKQAEPAKEIPALFSMWLDNANASGKSYNEKSVHIAFEKIHPFVDGNGRTGRIILNWMRVKSGRPVLVIYEKEKHKYYEWFN